MTTARIDPSETRAVFEAERQRAGGHAAPSEIGINSIVEFTKVEDYTTFLAEFAFVDRDIVLHFFPPREAYVVAGEKLRVVDSYLLWFQRRFPEVLSPVAEEYFQATKPVVVAQYVPEMTSWWMRCGGFAARLEPEAFIRKFFALLDQRIDASSKVAAPSV